MKYYNLLYTKTTPASSWNAKSAWSRSFRRCLFSPTYRSGTKACESGYTLSWWCEIIADMPVVYPLSITYSIWVGDWPPSGVQSPRYTESSLVGTRAVRTAKLYDSCKPSRMTTPRYGSFPSAVQEGNCPELSTTWPTSALASSRSSGFLRR